MVLLISELFGLAITIFLAIGVKSAEIFSYSVGLGKYFIISGTLFFSYFLTDAFFNLLWPLLARNMYRKIGWKKLFMDEAFFYGTDKVLCPIIVLFENAVAVLLIRYNFSEAAAISLASASQIPVYILGFVVLTAPLLLKREAQIKKQ